MLTMALELDTGRFGADSSWVILYMIRLLVRLESYIHTMILHNKNLPDSATVGQLCWPL